MKTSGELQEGQRHMEMEKMIELIDAVSKSDLTGFKYEEDGIKLHLSKKENMLCDGKCVCTGEYDRNSFCCNGFCRSGFC